MMRLLNIVNLPINKVLMVDILFLVISIVVTIFLRVIFILLRRKRQHAWPIFIIISVMAGWAVLEVLYLYSGLVVHPWGGNIPSTVVFSVLLGSLFAAPYLIRQVLVRRRSITEKQERLFRWAAEPLIGIGAGAVSLWELDRRLSDELKKTDRKSKKVKDSLRIVRDVLRFRNDSRLHSYLPIEGAIDFLKYYFDLISSDGRESISVHSSCIRSLSKEEFIKPAKLLAIVQFLQIYSAQFSKKLHLIFSRTELHPNNLIISSNIPGGDMYFLAPQNSTLETAKLAMLELFSKSNEYSDWPEFRKSPNKELEVLVPTFQPIAPTVSEWQEVEEYLGPELEMLSEYANSSEGYSRVYAQELLIHKVDSGQGCSEKVHTPKGEFETLYGLQGTYGVPEPIGLTRFNNFSVLTCTRCDGIPINEFLYSNEFSAKAQFACIAGLSNILQRIHRQGITHRDLLSRNVLVSSQGRVSLIDFDQAIGGADANPDVDLLGVSGSIRAWGSVSAIIRELGIYEWYETTISEFELAWQEAAESDASSPGMLVPYYDFLFGFQHFKGERLWIDRWDLLEDHLWKHVRGQRVLELGCNMGLLSTHIAVMGAAEVVGVDHMESILSSARRVATAVGVDVSFKQGDLGDEEFVRSLASLEPDIVLALSVIHWVENRAYLMKFLANVQHLFFEGHESRETELDMLSKLGFTKIKVLGLSERLRSVYYATRE